MNTMLLIDDDVYASEALALRLGVSLRSWRFLTARDGSEGVDVMNSMPVDFIVVNIRKSDVNGDGIIHYRNKRHPRVPLYATIDDADMVNALSAMRVSACIRKPYDFESLAQRILSDADVISGAALRM